MSLRKLNFDTLETDNLNRPKPNQLIFKRNPTLSSNGMQPKLSLTKLSNLKSSTPHAKQEENPFLKEVSLHKTLSELNLKKVHSESLYNGNV